MGSEMAHNLFLNKFSESPDSGFVVCDAIPESAVSFQRSFLSRFPEALIEVVRTPEDHVFSEQFRASATVVTMLPSSPEVQTVYTESNGIIPALRSFAADKPQQTLLIDSTTLDVDVARRVAGAAEESKALMIARPCVAGAKAGTLSFLVGGTEAAFRKAEPILAKICNNLVLGVQQIVVAEAMLLGQALGLDPAVLAGVINSSTGACWASSVNNPVPPPPCERDYEGGFATALMISSKDMRLATDIASARSSPLPLGRPRETCMPVVLKVSPELARKDFSSVYRYLKDLSGDGHD
ncbi:NAD-binding of NADP-dependent 3-hydroxyisobutyrate dehydrogenase-domain-containing protein [Pisolithus tinctorius]|nr:NAD-binding of NADP-dependent 3-hydroxyisobutyrate dehydrogenase-domain-containing protein [Pisolithus tinctorius]